MAEGCETRAGKENVLIQSGECSVRVLPEFGGKIASIRVRDRELLQAPLVPVASRTKAMAFDASDASGWDECVPSVAACRVETEAGVAAVPDHGDLWRVEWEQQSSGNREQGTGARGPEKNGVGTQGITLRGDCFSLPLTLKRTLDLKPTRKGWELQLQYTLTNTGRFAVPWSWAAHPLFAVEAGDRVELPDSMKTLCLEGSAGQRLGKKGDQVAWPCAAVGSGGIVDLSSVAEERTEIAEKLFAGPLDASEGWCVLHRAKAGVTIRFRFDPKATPYLGMWLCYGGWPERDGAKQMCVALEPATAPVDSLAETGKWTRMLAAGASQSWPLWVDLEG